MSETVKQEQPKKVVLIASDKHLATKTGETLHFSDPEGKIQEHLDDGGKVVAFVPRNTSNDRSNIVNSIFVGSGTTNIPGFVSILGGHGCLVVPKGKEDEYEANYLNGGSVARIEKNKDGELEPVVYLIPRRRLVQQRVFDAFREMTGYEAANGPVIHTGLRRISEELIEGEEASFDCSITIAKAATGKSFLTTTESSIATLSDTQKDALIVEMATFLKTIVDAHSKHGSQREKDRKATKYKRIIRMLNAEGESDGTRAIVEHVEENPDTFTHPLDQPKVKRNHVHTVDRG